MGTTKKVKYVAKTKTINFINGKADIQWQVIMTMQSKKEVPVFTAKAIRDKYNESLKVGNCNAHLRNSNNTIPFGSDCFIVNQFTNEIVDRYNAPMFEVIE